MASIDRVRYFDGEFLRAFDFDDEQTYHREMRRRLNRYLHLYGIVQGLELSEDTQGGVTTVSILPGLAIDAFGRELYVYQAYTFSDTDISVNRLSGPSANYDVWLRYKKTPSTQPSSGYAACNQTNEYTRWEESFSVVLLPSPSTPFTDPAFTDEDTDDPSRDQVGVLLGVVVVDTTSVTKQFSKGTLDERRVFLGLLAQRIRPPLDATKATPPFDILAASQAQTPLIPPASLAIEANAFAEQNLIVGQDFKVDKTKILPAPSGAYPNPTGNAKIASDLFLQGNLYWNVTNLGKQQWLALSEYIKQFAPDIVQATPVPVVVPIPTADGMISSTTPVSITSSKIAKISSFTAIPYLLGFQFDTKDHLVNNLKIGDQVQLRITAVTQLPPAGNTCTINVSWTAGPGIAGLFSAIQNFVLAAVFICYP